jgi:hypothetical protein
MHGDPRFFAANPPGISVRGSNLSVERSRQLERHKRHPAGDELGKCLVQCSTFLVENTAPNLDARLGERAQSFAGYQRIGVFYTDNHFLDTSSDQRVGAWWCSTVMIARFEIDIEGSSLSFIAGLFEGNDLGVIAAGKLVKSGCDHLTVAHQHCAHHRIGASPSSGFLSKSAGHPHIAPINLLLAPQQHRLVPLLSRSACSSRGYFFSFLEKLLQLDHELVNIFE